MAEYCGYITRLKNVEPHPNADRLLIGKCFDDNVIVDTTYTNNQLVVYFPAGTQLGEEYCEANNLVRKKDGTGGYLESSRCVKAINLRKSKSDGLCLPLNSLEKFTNVNELKEGQKITVLNSIVIASKYLPKRSYARRPSTAKKEKERVPLVTCPLFEEHIDTEHLDKNLSAFHNGDIVEITCKMDGTSQRTAYLPVTRVVYSKLRKFLHLPLKTTTSYEYINGTRRVVLERFDGGFYGNDEFRKRMADKLTGKLNRGEEVYYEIVGYAGEDGKPIRPTVDNKKVKDNEFFQMYGPVSEFSYGCKQDAWYEDMVPCCEMYVYRITMTNEDGYTVEYSPAQIRRRCEEIGVKAVPHFETFIIPEGVDPGEYVMEKAKQYYDGPDPVGKTHIREGVVVRILNRSNFAAYKLKNQNYKVLAGIAVDQLVSSGAIDSMTQDEIDEL